MKNGRIEKITELHNLSSEETSDITGALHISSAIALMFKNRPEKALDNLEKIKANNLEKIFFDCLQAHLEKLVEVINCPKPCEIWRHYKGTQYRILLSPQYHADNGELIVSYQNIDPDKDPTIYVHFLKDFCAIVPYQGNSVTRFVKMTEI